MTVLKWFAIAANAVLAAILSVTGVRIAVLVVEQSRSGYLPAYLPLVVGLATASLLLAAAIVAGLRIWLRTGRPRAALIADAVAALAVWSPSLLPLVFLPGGSFPLAWFLAPACLVLTAVVAWRDRPAAQA